MFVRLPRIRLGHGHARHSKALHGNRRNLHSVLRQGKPHRLALRNREEDATFQILVMPTKH